MSLAAITSREAILSAVREYDNVGREQFLANHGYRPARTYLLEYQGVFYDSKAIVGVAHGYQYPDRGPLRATEFSGGEATVKKLLEQLGFRVAAASEVRAPRYWALCANPKRYRIREAVAHVEVDYWLVGRSDLRSGDRVLVWQTSDGRRQRGVVALGRVIGDPAPRRDEGNPYWVNTLEGDQEHIRVPVRYETIASPRWVDESEEGSFLASLSVARSQGGTVFHVSAEQWRLVCELVGASQIVEPTVADAEASIRHPSRLIARQGFGLDTASKISVELHAMRVAKDYFSSRWASVEDVSARCSYDLLCKSGNEELRVEVKGTTSEGEQVRSGPGFLNS